MEKHEKRVQWIDHEWDTVCDHLYKRNPMIIDSKTMAGVSVHDVKAAMQAKLPEHRWRQSLNMTQIRPKLIERFVLIRAKLSVKKHEELIATPIVNTDAEILDAFVNLVVNRLFDRIKPMLAEMLTNKTAIEIPTGDTDAVSSRHRENRPKRLRAGVIGLLPIQAQEVIGTYPDIEFDFIEDGGRTSDIKAKLRNVDVVFGLTSKMPHSAETTIKSMPIWDKYVRVPGKVRHP